VTRYVHNEAVADPPVGADPVARIRPRTSAIGVQTALIRAAALPSARQRHGLGGGIVAVCRLNDRQIGQMIAWRTVLRTFACPHWRGPSQDRLDECRSCGAPSRSPPRAPASHGCRRLTTGGRLSCAGVDSPISCDVVRCQGACDSVARCASSQRPKTVVNCQRAMMPQCAGRGTRIIWPICLSLSGTQPRCRRQGRGVGARG